MALRGSHVHGHARQDRPVDQEYEKIVLDYFNEGGPDVRVHATTTPSSRCCVSPFPTQWTPATFVGMPGIRRCRRPGRETGREGREPHARLSGAPHPQGLLHQAVKVHSRLLSGQGQNHRGQRRNFPREIILAPRSAPRASSPNPSRPNAIIEKAAFAIRPNTSSGCSWTGARRFWKTGTWTDCRGFGRADI